MRVVGAVALALLVALILLLGFLVPVDQAVWLLVLLARGCTTDRTVDELVGTASIALTVLAVGAALLHARRQGLARTWPFAALVAVGALANAVLKVVFSRERPSNLPGVTDGHGFPSGHVMNAALAALVVLILANGFRRPWVWRLAAVTLVSIITAGRVLYGAHWFLDVVGALLAAVAFTGLALPVFERRPFTAPAGLALVLAAVLGLAQLVPSAVVRLPSPLTQPGGEFMDVEIGGLAVQGTMSGNWQGRSHEHPAGSFSRVLGAGGVQVLETSWAEAAKQAEAGDPSALQALQSPPPAGAPEELFVLVARPERDLDTCRVVRVAVNGHIIAGFVPFRGWREYRLPVPPGAYQRGFNTLQVAVRQTDGTPQRLAIARFRLRMH